MRKFIMSMVALGFLTAPMLMLQGCGDYTGDTEHYTDSNNDNSINYGEGDVMVCNESECAIYGSAEADEINKDGNATLGEFPGESADPAECNAAGFFWCSIERKCTRTPLDDTGGGSCNNNH